MEVMNFVNKHCAPIYHTAKRQVIGMVCVLFIFHSNPLNNVFFIIILFVSPVCMIEVHAPFSFRTPSSQATLKAKIITEIKNSIALHAVYCRLN